MAAATLGAVPVGAVTGRSGFMKSFFTDVLNLHEDPRTNPWPLVDNPLPLFLIIAFYLYFVKVAGPRLMEKRRPFELKNVLLVYNLVQVGLSVWMFWSTLRIVLEERYSVICQPVDTANSENGRGMAIMSYVYYLAKLTELLDTVFFVLRKKLGQVSTLHVYHHATMPLHTWMAVKYYPGGHLFLIGLINSFVHIVMYSYYLLAALGPAVQRWLWWKRYITQLQLAQFLILTVHAFAPLFVECAFPRWLAYWTALNTACFWYLFSKFYRETYRSRPRPGSSERPRPTQAPGPDTDGLTHTHRDKAT